MHIIKLKDIKKTKWKNGQGVTREVEISPKSSQVSDLNFDWRLSCAEISADNHFSLFPGYDRILVVWSEHELILNQNIVPSLTPSSFHGEEQIKCKLKANDSQIANSSTVLDLNLIYKRNQFCATIKIYQLVESSFEYDIGTQAEIQFIFCARNAIQANGLTLKSGEFLKMTEPGPLRLTGNSAVFFHIQIEKMKY